MTKLFPLTLLSVLAFMTVGFGQSPWINEIHYDNSGSDTNEGIEIAGPANTDLQAYTISLYNGSNGTVYNTVNLSGLIDDEGNGYGTLWFPITGLENGAPDGIALDNGTLIQFLSYEGTFVATDGIAAGQNSIDIGVIETGSTSVDQSLQLQGTGCSYDAFTWVSNISRSNGNLNSSQFISCATVDYANLQFPETGNINRCNTFDVYGEVYVDGVTQITGASPDIEAWVGYSSTNTDPNTWPTSNWIAADFNKQTGNNDEYRADLGPELDGVGTYYYATRFRYNGGPYAYGGYNSGFWDGSTNNNGTVTVFNEQADFANVQFPYTSNKTLCEGLDVYAQIYEPGITDLSGQGENIKAWIGYNSVSQTYGVTESSGWTWIEATYNSDSGNNDEYYTTIGQNLPPGTYYYASRFQINCNDYSYGGINSDGTGNFWGIEVNGKTAYSGILTINAPTEADVVITEVMYDSPGNDDEWIEICNVSNSTQDLSLSQITVNGDLVFTFPCNTTIIEGACITVSLGSDGDGIFNNNCAFTPNFGIDANTVNTNNLNNTSATITIVALDEVTVIDSVTYDESDGADGDGGTLHVIDTALDNSTTSINWWETINGGSPGINSLISPCTPVGPEINVEGTTANFPNISNGDTIPNTFDGTDFGNVGVNETSTSTFRIENFGGTQDLTISSVSVLSGDTDDFSITALPTSPIGPLDFSLFDIEFSPTATGIRTAVIQIINNDSNENPYTFTVKGNGLCVASEILAQPSSGPVGTVVTVTGTNLSTATASFNGLSAIVNAISDTQIEVTVPAGGSSGNLEIVDNLGCPGSTPFTVIESVISGCEGTGGTSPTDLFISEVTDANTGNLTYIEIYNGTGVTVNLANYSIQFFNNGNAAQNGGIVSLNDINLVNDNTYVVTVSSGANCSGIVGADGSLADQIGFGGINFAVNGDDHIRLYNGAIHIDSWGEFLSNTWADPLNIGTEGVVFRRNTNATSLPSTTFNSADWSYIDWTSCIDNDYSNIGIYDFSTGTPPSVSTQPNTIRDICSKTTSISVAGQEGFLGGNSLTYQWYVHLPGASGWTEITDTSIYSNFTTSTLDILNTFNLNGYQYYCQIREDDASCFTASQAVMLTLKQSLWNGSVWLPSDPDLSTIAVLSDDLTVTDSNSFSACQLFVNNGTTLEIGNNSYVEVQNDVYADGDITVQTSGAFVQNSHTAQLLGSGIMTVNKTTSILETVYDYTYWSSPIDEAVIGVSALENADPGRTFWYNAKNFEDRLAEIGNTGTYIPGQQDDIDDNGDDWAFAPASTAMINGLGYAATHNPSLYSGSGQYPYRFTGTFNTGLISVDIFRNDGTMNDSNWNLIGNPYPSAISINAFFNENVYNLNSAGAIEGALYIWSHSSPFDSENSGNEVYNFSNDDYIIVNAGGSVTANTSGSQLTEPYIPSGQAFFITMSDDPGVSTSVVEGTGGTVKKAEVRFTNAMRVTGFNNEFFRSSSNLSSISNKVWLNLTTETGLFCQTLISYIDGATSLFDGSLFDAKRSLSTSKPAIVYSIIPDNDQKFAIQGKAPQDLSIDESIILGFETDFEGPSVYTLDIDRLEGNFMTSQPIYLIDYYQGSIHNLKSSAYNFTSNTGVFTDRFKIVFNESSLSTIENTMMKEKLVILQNGDNITFKSLGGEKIQSIVIYDLSGRIIYSFESNTNEVVRHLPNIAKGAFIAEISFANSAVSIQKAVKL